MKPLRLRALDLSRRGKNIRIRLVTDEGSVDLSLPRMEAHELACALIEYAGR